jgi:hypothetical protein
MSEPRQDPANTQMFRAFVERGEQEAPRRRWVLPVAVLVVLAAILAIVLVLVLG